jgi:hypothetical protein
MSRRIINMQRQLRELGRLRSGYTGPKGPVRSKTWILTSKDRELLDAAAAEWGGQAVEWTPLNRTDRQWSLTTDTAMLPAFLPPGDPLNQANELWSGGGAQRRCDGATEEKTGKPCLCLAQFGPNWHTQDKKLRCQPYSHLNLMLLNLPEVGQWRHTTKSFYGAAEIAGQVDLIKARIGPEPIVPVWLIIDQREKVADGKKTPYPVPVIKIRGAESGAALLAGNVPTLELGPARERVAIGAAPAIGGLTVETATTADHFRALANAARDPQEIRDLWDRASQRGVLDVGMKAHLTARAQDLGAEVKPNGTRPVSAPPAPTEPPIDPDADEPDQAGTWMQILALAGAPPRRWSADDLEKRVIARFEKSSDEINGWQMQTFLGELKNGSIQ